MNKDINILPEEFTEIEQYLLKEMTEEKRELFEKRIASEKDLKAKVHTVRLILTGIRESQLSKDLGRIHDGMQVKNAAPEPGGKVFKLSSLLVAASIVIVAAIGLFLYVNSPAKEEKLYATYYKPDTGLISAMSASDDYVFERAMIDYKTGLYSEAIRIWDSLSIIHPQNDTLQYFLGSAYLATEKFEKAITQLKMVAGHKNSFFFQDANWYLGLAFLKQKNKEQAIYYIERSGNAEKETLIKKIRD